MYSDENQRIIIMKTKIFFITSLLLIVGCSKEPINYETTLVERDDVYYTKDTNKPYSGQVFCLYKYGDKKDEGTLKDGRMISRTEWEWYDYESGQKKSESPFKDGKQDGLGTLWYEDGQKYIEITFKNGKLDGLYTFWYESGQKKSELTYKDGKYDGLWTDWYENGQKEKEVTHKDGEIISIKGWNKDGSVMND
jgi:antitoxin component YwqK of YwqJK toxin-antitoxin module